MSVPSYQAELPKSGRTWITLVASTALLSLLFVWALQNPNLFLSGNPDSAQNVITNQSETDSTLSQIDVSDIDVSEDLSENTDSATQSGGNARASDIELVKKQIESQAETPVNENPDPATQTAEQLTAVKVKVDQQQPEVKQATDDAEQRLTEQLATNEETRTADQEIVRTLEIAGEQAVSDNIATETDAENALAEQNSEPMVANDSASQMSANEEQDARQLAALKLAAAESEQLANETSFAEKLAKEKLAVDKTLADKLAAEKTVTDSLSVEENRVAEQAVAETSSAEEKAADEKAADEKAVDEKVAAEKAAEEQTVAEKTLAEDRLANSEVKTDDDTNAANQGVENQPADNSADQPADQLAALSSARINNPTQQAAPETESEFERTRRKDLAELQELAAQIRFATNDTVTTGDSKELMDRMFELLFLYSETTVTVQVASNEYEVDDTNQLISRLRSLVIINYLIKRGLDEGRFNIEALGKQDLPFDSHLVSVVATVIDNGDR